MGLINQVQDTGKQSGQIADPTLQAVQQQITADVPKQMQQLFTATVLAGMKIMFSPQTTNLMQQRVQQSAQSPNPAQAIGDVIGRLMVLIQKETGGKVQLEAAIPAAIVLMCHMLDYAMKTNQLQVDKNFIATATKATIASTLKYFGVTPQMMAQAAQQNSNQQAGGQ